MSLPCPDLCCSPPPSEDSSGTGPGSDDAQTWASTHPYLSRNRGQSRASQGCGDSGSPEVRSFLTGSLYSFPTWGFGSMSAHPFQLYSVPPDLKTGNPPGPPAIGGFPKSPLGSAGLPLTNWRDSRRQVLRLALWSCRSELRLGWNVPGLVLFRSEVRETVGGSGCPCFLRLGNPQALPLGLDFLPTHLSSRLCFCP